MKHDMLVTVICNAHVLTLASVPPLAEASSIYKTVSIHPCYLCILGLLHLPLLHVFLCNIIKL